MFNFLKKKITEEDEKTGEDEQGGETEEEKEEDEIKEKEESKNVSGKGDLNQLTRLSTEVERIKASVEGFTEIRKSFTERFSRISEQIGELRSMILERDKTIQEIELKAIKSSDLVESVHPEKIMTEVQKQNARTEALKANLEGNEAIMERVMEELKETKRKVEFFRGVEEIVKLSEEVKKELIEIKKTESKIAINTDKVETIYTEIRGKFKDVDGFKSDLQEIKVQVEQNTKDVEFLKEKTSNLVEKEELDGLVKKVQNYIDVLKTLEKKSSLSKDVDQLRGLLEGLK
jgi:DNA repair exonuclease SbcCD ATPase subunit